MEIYNEQGVGITEEEVDLSKGYLRPERLDGEWCEATPEIPEKSHYEVICFNFTDGTSLYVSGNEDEHVSVIDAKHGLFDYIDKGEGKTKKGAMVKKIIDQEYVPAQKAHQTYTDIQRYVLYTDEELAARAKEEEAQKKQELFLTKGPDQLEANTASLEDLTVMISEMVGGAE